MFQLLDIAYPGRPYRPRIILEPDTPKIVKIDKVDTMTAPEGTDSIIPQELLDSCKESVADTIRSAVNLFNDWGTGDGSSSLLLTTLVVAAALTLCGGFVWMYRRNLQQQHTL